MTTMITKEKLMEVLHTINDDATILRLDIVLDGQTYTYDPDFEDFIELDDSDSSWLDEDWSDMYSEDTDEDTEDTEGTDDTTQDDTNGETERTYRGF